MAGKAPGDVGPATRQKLGSGPQDMPDRGGRKPNLTNAGVSTTVPLGRGEHPVANLEVKAGMGRVQSTGTQCKLSRAVADPYGQINKTVPKIPGKKGR